MPNTPSPCPLPSTPKPNPHTQIHSYTLCPHTSPPANRPLDTQPVLDRATNESTITGRCPKCDQVFRRDAESAILTDYSARIRTVERQYGVFDEAFLDHQVAELYKERDVEVAKVWQGFARKWGPGCVGWLENGQMKLAWERPELVEKKKKKKEGKGV